MSASATQGVNKNCINRQEILSAIYRKAGWIGTSIILFREVKLQWQNAVFAQFIINLNNEVCKFFNDTAIANMSNSIVVL